MRRTGQMEGRKYECRKCGKSFEMKEKDKAPKCVHCGSTEAAPVEEKAAAASCGPRRRFT
jgi:rubrerythrin